MKIHDVQTIITALGGRARLQALLGVGASAISNYLARNELPQRAVGPVCEALRARGYSVDPARLEIIGQSHPVQNYAGEGHTEVSHLAADNPSMTMSPASNRRVLLIVGGGIAAYKALEVAVPKRK